MIHPSFKTNAQLHKFCERFALVSSLSSSYQLACFLLKQILSALKPNGNLNKTPPAFFVCSKSHQMLFLLGLQISLPLQMSANLKVGGSMEGDNWQRDDEASIHFSAHNAPSYITVPSIAPPFFIKVVLEMLFKNVMVSTCALNCTSFISISLSPHIQTLHVAECVSLPRYSINK